MKKVVGKILITIVSQYHGTLSLEFSKIKRCFNKAQLRHDFLCNLNFLTVKLIGRICRQSLTHQLKYNNLF